MLCDIAESWPVSAASRVRSEMITSASGNALVIISLRTRDAAETGQLSAMSQSIGYLVASAGPLLFGVLHDVTAGWSTSLIAVMVVLVVQAVLGVFAGRPKTV